MELARALFRYEGERCGVKKGGREGEEGVGLGWCNVSLRFVTICSRLVAQTGSSL